MVYQGKREDLQQTGLVIWRQIIVPGLGLAVHGLGSRLNGDWFPEPTPLLISPGEESRGWQG